MADQNRALYDAVLFDHEGGEDDLRACVASCERASDILEKIALAVSARGTPAALDASRNAVRISFEHGGSDKCKLSALWHLTENMMTSLNAPHPALDDGLLALLRQGRGSGDCFDLLVAMIQYLEVYRHLTSNSPPIHSSVQRHQLVLRHAKYMAIARRFAEHCRCRSESERIGVAVPSDVIGAGTRPEVIPGVTWATLEVRDLAIVFTNCLDQIQDAVADMLHAQARDQASAAREAASRVGDTDVDEHALFSNALAMLGIDACFACQGRIRGGLEKCKRCKLAHYCSAQCQKSDWHSTHRGECRSNGELKPLDFVDFKRDEGTGSRWILLGAVPGSGEGGARTWRIRRVLTLADIVEGEIVTACERELLHNPNNVRVQRFFTTSGRTARGLYMGAERWARMGIQLPEALREVQGR